MSPLFHFLSLASLPVQSTIYHVSPTGLSSNTGFDWTSTTDLQHALDISTSFDEIWLKGGLYIPNTTSRDSCFWVNHEIKIYGGFLDESRISDRQSTNEQSIISGNINDENTNTDNCYHVLSYAETLTLDRLIVADGYANYDEQSDYSLLSHTLEERQSNDLHKYGAALITTDSGRSSTLILNEVTFTNNTAINGGALRFSSNHVLKVNAFINHCVFVHNEAILGQHEGGYGGAIYLFFTANVSIKHTVFNENKAAVRGGAIYQDYGGILDCFNCTFSYNAANGFGGALFSEDRNSQTIGTFPVIKASKFVSNSAGIYGGAICLFNGANATLINNEFTSNTASNRGGAIAKLKLSFLTGVNSNDFSQNIATLDPSTNDLYTNETQVDCVGIDENLNVNLTEHLWKIYAEAQSMDTDVRPFEPTDEICFVDIDAPDNYGDGKSWSEAKLDMQDCLNQLMLTGGEILNGSNIPGVIHNL